jgi:ferrochelatase
MKIEDILNLTEGILSNTPEVHAIESATAFPSKVGQGDLFFATHNEDIPTAVANGAYAIIYEGTVEIIDDEIAWIRVNSIKESAFRLLRYVLLSKEANFYLLDKHEMSLFKMVLTHKGNVTFLSDTWNKTFEQILNGDGHLFVSTDTELMRLIKPESTKLTKETEGYAVSDTLFKSTFRIGKYIYQDVKLVPFHLEYLLRVIHLCDQYDLPYSIDRIQYTRHFMPLYIDNNLHTVTQGASDKVLIFTDDLSNVIKARDYVRYQTTWVKSVVLTPPKTKVDNVERPYWFETVEEAREILTAVHYNYAFVYSLDKAVFKSFEEQREDQGLF